MIKHQKIDANLESKVNLDIIHWRIVLVVDGMGLIKITLDCGKIFIVKDMEEGIGGI